MLFLGFKSLLMLFQILCCNLALSALKANQQMRKITHLIKTSEKSCPLFFNFPFHSMGICPNSICR